MQPRIIITDDGSHTATHTCGDCYHSKHGSIQESQHVFIENGYKAWKKLHPENSFRPTIVEVGLGTGLNAYMTALHITDPISYIGIDPEPFTQYADLNYPQILTQDPSLFEAIHQTSHGQSTLLTKTMTFQRLEQPLQTTNLINIDIIFFDAFAPRHMPEMWTEDVLVHCFNMLNSGGLWVSYCTKGEVCRRLKKIGFECLQVPGPKGKRTMMQAVKPER